MPNDSLTQEEIRSFAEHFRFRVGNLAKPYVGISEAEIRTLTDDDFGIAAVVLEAMKLVRRYFRRRKQIPTRDEIFTCLADKRDAILHSTRHTIKRTDTIDKFFATSQQPTKQQQPNRRRQHPTTPTTAPRVVTPVVEPEPSEEVLQLRTYFEDKIGVLGTSLWTLRNSEAAALLRKRKLGDCVDAIDAAATKIQLQQEMNVAKLAQEQCIALVLDELNN